MKRTCKHCGIELTRREKEDNCDFVKRKFCKRECYLQSKTIGPKTKICVICNKEYGRVLLIANSQWEKSKVCGIDCRKIYLKKINAGFKKGHPVYSEKGRFTKGQLAHNKGKKGQIPWNKGKPFFAVRGERNNNWKGGTSKLRDKIKVTYNYKKWRTEVFARDKYTCQMCKIKGVTLQAHHIKSFSLIRDENKIKTTDDARKCHELWDISNGLTLCVPCHKKTDTYGNRLKTKIT